MSISGSYQHLSCNEARPIVLLQVPADQLPSYKSHKEQLAGVDASIVNRVTTDFAAAYADAMAEHDISKQAYVKSFRDK